MTETWPSNDPGAPIDRDRQIELMRTTKERIKDSLDYWMNFPEVQKALRRPAPGQKEQSAEVKEGQDD